jgi:GT2 family glycosyltransferase
MHDVGTVTVIVPTHNRRDLVVRAVRSVLDQTYANLRCVVVDNGSNDGTEEALGSLNDARVTVVVRDAPLAPAAARNVGLLLADGTPWVAFLDSDDLWAPGKVEAQLLGIAANASARWSAVASVQVGPDLRVAWVDRLCRGAASSPAAMLVASEDMVDLLKNANAVPGGGSGVLASLELVQEVGSFKLEPPTCEDWDLWLRLARVSPLVYIDRPLVAYRVWDAQRSTDVRVELSSASVLRARYFPESGPLPLSYLAQTQRRTAWRELLAGRRKEAMRVYARSAWAGRNLGALGYAVAAGLVPRSLLEQLFRLKRARQLPTGWEEEADAWLVGLRTGP